MLSIVAAALLGGPLTTALLWGQGPVTALLCAPLGGSVAGLAVALAIGAFRHADDAETTRTDGVPVGQVSVSP